MTHDSSPSSPETNHVARVLGPLEAEVMRVFWATSTSMTVREVLAAVNGRRPQQLAYTTVMTVMSRLAEKDVLRRHRDGRGYRYVPTVHDAAGVAVHGVVRDFGEAALAPFVDEMRADPQLLDRLRQFLKDED